METRLLGRTGLQATRLGYGSGELRQPAFGGREVPEEQAATILNAVLDAGINFLDTAPDYGPAEDWIGRHVGHRRGEFYLATKAGCDPAPGPDGVDMRHTWTREVFLRGIDQSLRRLRTDYVDVLQMHNPSVADVQDGHLVDALREIQSRGMTRFIGVSTTQPHVLRFIEMGVFDTFQIPYSCLRPEHHDLIAQAAAAGAGIIIRGGIAKGAPDNHAARPEFADRWRRAGLDEVLPPGMGPHELILRYTLSHPNSDTVIVATTSAEHLRDNLRAAAAGALPPQLYEEVRTRVARAVQDEKEHRRTA